jgi:hypothetical protein
MQADAGGVNQAVAAFFRNDPYFPQLIPGDEWLWEVFKKEYLLHSTSITGGDVTLAELFISSVEEEQAERERRKQA